MRAFNRTRSRVGSRSRTFSVSVIGACGLVLLAGCSKPKPVNKYFDPARQHLGRDAKFTVRHYSSSGAAEDIWFASPDQVEYIQGCWVNVGTYTVEGNELRTETPHIKSNVTFASRLAWPLSPKRFFFQNPKETSGEIAMAVDEALGNWTNRKDVRYYQITKSGFKGKNGTYTEVVSIDRMQAKACAINLHNLAMACQTYAKSHDGNFPKSLNELFPS